MLLVLLINAQTLPSGRASAESVLGAPAGLRQIPCRLLTERVGVGVGVGVGVDVVVGAGPDSDEPPHATKDRESAQVKIVREMFMV